MGIYQCDMWQRIKDKEVLKVLSRCDVCPLLKAAFLNGLLFRPVLALVSVGRRGALTSRRKHVSIFSPAARLLCAFLVHLQARIVLFVAFYAICPPAAPML